VVFLAVLDFSSESESLPVDLLLSVPVGSGDPVSSGVSSGVEEPTTGSPTPAVGLLLPEAVKEVCQSFLHQHLHATRRRTLARNYLSPEWLRGLWPGGSGRKGREREEHGP
jgi:hypothetical protein